MNKKLRLTELNKKKMQGICGGSCGCHCGCVGESGDVDNGVANRDGGYDSPGGGSIYMHDVRIVASKC